MREIKVKGYNILFLIVLTILLSGCSLNEGTEKLYSQKKVLKIEMLLPSELQVNKDYEFQAVLTDAAGEVPEIENITFTIWKNGEKTKEEIVPESEGNGTYRIAATFIEEGLYFVKVDADTADSRIMPTKQFTVGSLTEEDLRSLPNQREEQHPKGHH
jgi:hypothetical protein